jgi:hypothetical protein
MCLFIFRMEGVVAASSAARRLATPRGVVARSRKLKCANYTGAKVWLARRRGREGMTDSCERTVRMPLELTDIVYAVIFVVVFVVFCM